MTGNRKKISRCKTENIYQCKQFKKENGSKNDQKSSHVACPIKKTKENRVSFSSAQHKNKNKSKMTQEEKNATFCVTVTHRRAEQFYCRST